VKRGGLSARLRAGIFGERLAISNSVDASMAKRFYVSSRKDRSAQADALSEILKAKGWERTFIWTDQDGKGPGGHAEIAVKELEGVQAADVLVVLLPGGYGTHVEIGAALAMGKAVIIHSPDHKILETPYPCIFHYHPAVKLLVSEVLDIEAVLACMESCVKLKSRRGGRRGFGRRPGGNT
jgi:Nucleoside 2-deoxyribosyltransferase